MSRLTHDPLSQGELDDKQWLGDLLGGMLRMSSRFDRYNYDRMMNRYGQNRVESVVEVYDDLRRE